MVSEDPLTVKVDHLKEKPYDKDDDILNATSFEVISTLRDILKTTPIWRDHAQTYTQDVALATKKDLKDLVRVGEKLLKSQFQVSIWRLEFMGPPQIRGQIRRHLSVQIFSKEKRLRDATSSINLDNN